MPELPEVEIVRRGLEPVMAGCVIEGVEQRRRDLRFPLPKKFHERVAGKRVLALGRRAKYLIAPLQGGDTLLMHLGMTGRFTVSQQHTLQGQATAKQKTVHLGEYVFDSPADPAHDHVVFHMEQGTTITYNDPRRFGFMLLIAAGEFEQHPLIKTLGLEPLGNDFSAAQLAVRAKGRRSDLKAFLMNQRVVAGLGNIYAAEALFRAGLSPKRKAACLAFKTGKPTARAEALVTAIRAVLTEALVAGGSTLRDYRQTDGSQGAFQEAHAVYDRAGQRCVRARCKGTIVRLVQGQRATFYCPCCQR